MSASKIVIPKHIVTSLLTEGDKRYATVGSVTKNTVQLVMGDGIRIDLEAPKHGHNQNDKLVFDTEGHVIEVIAAPVVTDTRPANRSGSNAGSKHSHF